MSHQDEFYFEVEANAFYQRCIENINFDADSLRPAKKMILDDLKISVGDKLNGSNVLEVGCFLGDLLAYLKREHECTVVGIEPSSLACNYAKKAFSLTLINNVFTRSSYFNCTQDNFSAFDIIILDDVLSWMPRETILPVLGSIDWLLKPNGILFIRDFCPSVDFAYPNHHQKDKNVYNYKVAGGHKKFFLHAGTYIIQQERIRNTQSFQAVSTSRVDSMIWSDSILLKTSAPIHPCIDMAAH
jgi:2-polyprenyl-3-methyl-5-hydroxy-6-metoxy-1,4-benzoquinol methylase